MIQPTRIVVRRASCVVRRPTTNCFLLPCVLSALLYAGTSGDIESRVTEYTLNNGLQVLVYVDSSAPVVTTAVAYRVGSVDEPLGLTGISHQLEHMTFKHTDVYQPGQLFRIVADAGGRNNGFTGNYQTTYYETFSRDRWDLGLKIEAARMSKCLFIDSEFKNEHQVVLEEVHLHENSPYSAFYVNLYAAAYQADPLHNPGIGWTRDVENLNVDKVRDWYQRHYNPANAVLVVAGDVRPAEVKASVEHYFGGLQGRPVPRTDFYDVEPPQTGERRFVLHRQVSAPSLLIAWHALGIRDSGRFAGDVLGGVLGGGRNSRLYRTLVLDSALAVDASAANNYEVDPGLFIISVTPKAESLVPRIERIVEHEIDQLRNEAPTDREMQQVKNSTVAGFVFSLDDISNIALVLCGNQATAGTWRVFETYPDDIARVTGEQVRDFCRTYLNPDNKTVGLMVAERKEKK
jgi:zinc protease